MKPSLYRKNTYNKFIETSNLNKLTCFCGISANLINHTHYDRHIKTPDGVVILTILSLKCRCCGKAHTIFP